MKAFRFPLERVLEWRRTQLEMEVRDRDVSSGGGSVKVKEKTIVMLTRRMCEEAAARPEGLELKYFGKRGNYQLVVPREYFQGWLNWLKRQANTG